MNSLKLNFKMTTCPLCDSKHCEAFHSDKRRDYLRCTQCDLVFVPEHQRLSCTAEKAEYDKHENSPHDAGYRQFLSRIADPLLASLKPASEGLDFGCGPGPTLSVMLEEHGHKLALYDCFYFANEHVWQQQFDFISATEVIEHLHQPKQALERIWNHLRPNGQFAVMSKLVIDKDAFANWHYKNDQTHVCFFSKKTLAWLAEKWKAKLTYYGKDAFIFTRPC